MCPGACTLCCVVVVVCVVVIREELSVLVVDSDVTVASFAAAVVPDPVHALCVC